MWCRTKSGDPTKSICSGKLSGLAFPVLSQTHPVYQAMIRLREGLARWNTFPWRMLSHAVPASQSGATEQRAAGSWTPSPMPRASTFTCLLSSLPHHHAPLSAGTLAELTAAVSGRLSTAPSVLTQHGTDESYHEPMPPEAVRLGCICLISWAVEVGSCIGTCKGQMQ